MIAVVERLLAADPAEATAATRRRCPRRAQSACRPPRADPAAAPAAAITNPRSSTSTGTPTSTTSPSTTEAEQDEGDDEVGHDRAREPRRDVKRAARAHRVVRNRRDDLARREAAPHRRPRARRVVGDDLRHAEGGLEPVEDGVTVAHDSRPRLDGSETEQREPARRARDCRCSRSRSSIAWPIAKSISAWATIHRMPKETPATSVGIWWRPTQSRSRAGDRVSGTPGSSSGRWTTPVRRREGVDGCRRPGQDASGGTRSRP